MRAFISYSSLDSDIALRVAHELKIRGIKVWIDQRNAGAGDVLPSVIKKGMDSAKLFVIVLTKNWTNSTWTQREFKHMTSRIVKGKARVIPLLFPDGKLPELLERNEYRYEKCTSGDDVAKAINFGLKDTKYEIPFDAKTILKRFKKRVVPNYGIRLIPLRDLDENGSLGLPERRYVFIGDYLEQCGQSLQEVLDNLYFDNSDKPADANIEWAAITFEIGKIQQRNYDLLPASWKAIFRIMSDKKRIGEIKASKKDLKKLKQPYRRYDYYGDDDHWFWRLKDQLKQTDRDFDEIVNTYFGIQDCFEGDGFGGPRRSRIFVVKNLKLSLLKYTVQNMKRVEDGILIK